jgi:hypothetical protein
MAAISGKVSSIVHPIANPSCAPAWLYVPIPEGSSSEAPVISPGPKTLSTRPSKAVGRERPWLFFGTITGSPNALNFDWRELTGSRIRKGSPKTEDYVCRRYGASASMRDPSIYVRRDAAMVAKLTARP